jgi:hypothetical protein
VLHLLLKRALAGAGGGGGGAAILALAQPFSHYDRVLRKMVSVSPAFRRTPTVLARLLALS